MMGDELVLDEKVRVDQNPELVGRYAVRATPTIVVVRGGCELVRTVGAVSRIELDRLFAIAGSTGATSGGVRRFGNRADAALRVRAGASLVAAGVVLGSSTGVGGHRPAGGRVGRIHAPDAAARRTPVTGCVRLDAVNDVTDPQPLPLNDEALAAALIELYPFALSITRDRDMAADLIQGACLRASRSVGQWRGDAPLAS